MKANNLEEAAKKYANKLYFNDDRVYKTTHKEQKVCCVTDFKAGAEWQQSQHTEPIEDIELEKYIFIPVQDFIDTVKITEGEIKRYKDWLEKEPDNVKFQLMKIAYEEKLKFINHLFESFKTQQGNNLPEQQGWISVEDKPLIHQTEHLGWEVNEGVPDEFMAALQVDNKMDGKTYWWIRHCIIEDGIGLCVVGDDENEPCGWQITDIEFWQPLPAPPKK